MNKDEGSNSWKMRNKRKEKKLNTKKGFDSDGEYDIFEESSLNEEKGSENSQSFSFQKIKKNESNQKCKRKRSKGIKQLQQETVQHRTMHQQFELIEKSLKFPSNFHETKVENFRNEESNCKKIISLEAILLKMKDKKVFLEEELKIDKKIEQDCPLQPFESQDSGDKKFKKSHRNQKDRFKSPYESNKRTLVRKIFSHSRNEEVLSKSQRIQTNNRVNFLKIDFYQERFYYLVEINKQKVWMERQKVIERYLPELVQFYEKFLKFI